MDQRNTAHVTSGAGGGHWPLSDSEQAEIAFTNVGKRLEQAGASAEDIVKTNVYIKDIDPEKVQQVGRAHAKVLRLDPPRASTWVGVTGLVYPSLLIEVEATAVVAAE